MSYYIKQFLLLAFKRINPQDIPVNYSAFLLVFLLSVLLDSYITILVIENLTFPLALAKVAVYYLVILSAVMLLLVLLGYRNRAIQTLTAIMAAGLVVSLTVFPLLLINTHIVASLRFYIVIVFIDNVWRIIINAHIFENALSIEKLMAFILSVSYLLLGLMTADYLL